MKTYNERLNLIAEEMAKAEFNRLYPKIDWEFLHINERDTRSSIYLPLAAIALKHMALMWEEGYRNWDGKHDIQSLGLIEPQTT